MPNCEHVAPSKMDVQGQCTGQPVDLVCAAGETLGLDHWDEFGRLPGENLFKAWDVSGVDIDSVHTIQLLPPGQLRPLYPLGL